MRFFFDYRTTGDSLYDYTGSEFGSIEAAVEFAGAIAEHLKHSLTRDWSDWRIEVRSAEGRTYSALSVASVQTAAG
jgi:hypothetical protein